jgi:hypothetical protein
MGTLSINLGSLKKAENRIQEIAIVTASKAPELLAFFNSAYLEGSRLIALLELEVNRATRSANAIKSVVILDRAPEILKAKGLATDKNPGGSADLRQAVLEGDSEYQAALEVQQHLEATLELIKGKNKGIEMAYTSVKKILGESSYETRRNPNLSGDTGDLGIGVDPLEEPEPLPPRVVNGFGVSKF